ncbi:hypothetical protein Tsubulata_015296 [Turnera subulata]|uniref:Uncharacterized protein n=1 Tax=Turnera subulata TaxID=218843 RepID=A0A9Q0JDE6_9ROSI|nr:hypothetical protein Tsubulata_015296 [Turnera subulata]
MELYPSTDNDNLILKTTAVNFDPSHRVSAISGGCQSISMYLQVAHLWFMFHGIISVAFILVFFFFFFLRLPLF